jgi:hypothetical protein
VAMASPQQKVFQCTPYALAQIEDYDRDKIFEWIENRNAARQMEPNLVEMPALEESPARRSAPGPGELLEDFDYIRGSGVDGDDSQGFGGMMCLCGYPGDQCCCSPSNEIFLNHTQQQASVRANADIVDPSRRVAPFDQPTNEDSLRQSCSRIEAV